MTAKLTPSQTVGPFLAIGLPWPDGPFVVPEAARDRLISRFDLSLTVPEWALGFTWDIVLRGRGATAFEPPDGQR